MKKLNKMYETDGEIRLFPCRYGKGWILIITENCIDNIDELCLDLVSDDISYFEAGKTLREMGEVEIYENIKFSKAIEILKGLEDEG